MSIQAIEQGSSLGYQVRIFRKGEAVATKFLSYGKYGGKRRAYAEAQREFLRMEAEVERQYGPSLRVDNEFGHHHQVPRSDSRTKIPGITIDYNAGYKRPPSLTVHVRWMEGEGEERRQRHTSFSTRAYGLLGAIQKALDKRFEKTGIEQSSARSVWLQLRSFVPPKP